MHQDLYLSEGAIEIKNYFSKRMAKSLELKPYELWNDYYLISNLFPQDRFWLNYYHSMLNNLDIQWSLVNTLDWVGTQLIPSIYGDKTHPKAWNRTFLANLLGLIKQERILIEESMRPQPTPPNSQLVAPLKLFNNPQAQAKTLFSSLEAIDLVFEFTDLRTAEINSGDLIDLQQKYFGLLQELPETLNQSPVIATLWSHPSFSSSLLESVAISSLILGAQTHKLFMGLDSPRIKAYFGRHDELVLWLAKTDRRTDSFRKLRQAYETFSYLRAAISLRLQLSPSTDIISKGQWLSNKHFQSGIELLWNDELNKAHLEVLRTLQLTLYNVSLVDKCYRENLQTPTCQKWRANFPIRYREVLNDKGLKQARWELESSTPIVLPAGQIILREHETLSIRAPQIYFNWLTKIIAPSGRVELRGNKIVYPWIDVSGSNATEGPKTMRSPGQRPWIKNSQACATRDYLEGVNLLKLPGRDQAKWVGFSMENPFPNNLLICSSTALQKNKESVADIEQMVDLGTPPEAPETSVPIKGAPGGSIKLEIDVSSQREGLQLPLLLAMGGDGSPGSDGQSSPLCQKGVYQSFKVALSHHKNWFQKWVDYQTDHPQLKLLSKSEYEDHWYGTFEINLPRTGGSNGGDAGSGGQITLLLPSSQADSRPRRWFLSSGNPGEAGQSGLCGPNEVESGKMGKAAHAGSMNILRK